MLPSWKPGDGSSGNTASLLEEAGIIHEDGVQHSIRLPLPQIAQVLKRQSSQRNVLMGSTARVQPTGTPKEGGSLLHAPTSSSKAGYCHRSYI